MRPPAYDHRLARGGLGPHRGLVGFDDARKVVLVAEQARRAVRVGAHWPAAARADARARKAEGVHGAQRAEYDGERGRAPECRARRDEPEGRDERGLRHEHAEGTCGER